MKTVVISLSLFSALYCAASFCFGQSEDTEVDEKATLCGIFESPILNAEGWENGDCLVRDEVVVDNVKLKSDGTSTGIFIDKRSLVRTAFDYSNRRFASYEFTTVSYTDFDTLIDGEAKVTEKTTWRAGCVDFEAGRIWLNDNNAGYRSVELLDKDNLGTVNVELIFRDYRACWDMNDFGLDAFLLSKQSNEFRKRGAGCTSASKSGDVVNIRFKFTSNLDYLIGPFQTYKFDSASSMPILFSEYHLDKKTKQKIDGPSVKTTWQDFNDIFVPSKLSMDKPVLFQVNEKDQLGAGDRDLVFHWFSMNSEEEDNELFDRLFDGTFVKEYEEFLKVVDPSKAKATSILEFEKKEENAVIEVK